ncbi:dipeptidyl aminopeptidase/acylaminoacyl peptidase [Pseudoduganella lurida]|uniref:Dipeptidyl aminopeptidase/acylaminoacyl peptidase n=1 Tax=Pseudoduganella lurida TaxID=1036180 RepID=A0A562RNH0_9BURK|nr:S9 family peptidase [Pseudoduganella lurida]TWI69956.1 dipeptidyl aminopeptidase/acylaminoacyl peptidase [Pseudoduganella lurida]
MKLRLLVTCAALAAATSALAAPRGLTIEDLASMDRAGSPALSPDAARVVYTVRSTNLEKNRGNTQLWMIDLRAATPVPQQLTSHDASASDPEWSASGDAVYFLSGRSGSPQVWRLPVNGGEAVRVTDLPVDVDSFHVSPKGDRLAVTLAVFRDCADLACTKQRTDDKPKASGKVYDQMFVRHWDTWADGRRNVLYSVPLVNGMATQAVSLSGTLDGDITSKPFGDRGEYTFSPDGQRIVFSVRVAGRSESWSTNFDLYDVPAAGGAAPRNLTADNPAWDTRPQFSPDGKTLAYLAMRRPGFEADRFYLILQDVASGKKRVLAESWDRSIADYRWRADGKALLANADDLGNHRLFSLDVASGKVSALTGKGYVAEFDVRRDTVVMARNSLADGAQLYKLKAGATSEQQATPLTQLNAARLADVKMGEYEQFSFQGANGATVYGHVMKPWNAQPGRKYPVAFLVHGGPQGSFGNAWSYRWNPQVYAGAGYATVFIDFHGSTGYGQAFTDAISKDWGGKPLEDLQKGLAAAGEKYPWLDVSNACALGASYGGYMMNWIQGRWSDGFKCIVNHDGVFDQRGMAYATEELWFTEWENGGTYYDNPEGYEKFNPVHYVNNWKTPMLVVQGDLDFRIPTSQGLAAFAALQRRGIESRLLVFPDENHWVLKPANSILWHHTVIDWLNEHLQK